MIYRSAVAGGLSSLGRSLFGVLPLVVNAPGWIAQQAAVRVNAAIDRCEDAAEHDRRLRSDIRCVA